MADRRGVSRQSFAQARERLNGLLDGGADAAALSGELFGVVGLFGREHGVRRILSDPAQPSARKAELATSLLRGRVGEPAVEIVAGVAASRWSTGGALVDAVEDLAVEAEVAAAERAGRAEELEDELFRFERIVAGASEVAGALADPVLPVDRKQGLLSALLEGKVTDSTLRLTAQAVAQPRGRSVEATLRAYGQTSSERRRRLVAFVRTAVPLTDAERDRLAAALTTQYGRQVHITTEVDPAVVGGVSVLVGSDLIDGTLARKLDDARRRLTA